MNGPRVHTSFNKYLGTLAMACHWGGAMQCGQCHLQEGMMDTKEILAVTVLRSVKEQSSCVCIFKRERERD